MGNNSLSQSPAELLDPSSFRAFLDTLQAHYDIILMEAAALNQYADAQELESFADKVIAVFNANSSLQPADQDSLAFLHGLGGKFAGAVLTEVSGEV